MAVTGLRIQQVLIKNLTGNKIPSVRKIFDKTFLKLFFLFLYERIKQVQRGEKNGKLND